MTVKLRPLTPFIYRCHRIFLIRFTYDTLEKFLLTNSRHARSGEMRRRLYYSHQKFGQVRLPTNAARNADFLNYIGQQTCKNTFAGIIGHLNLFVNSNNCNFTFKITDKTMLCGWSFLP